MRRILFVTALLLFYNYSLTAQVDLLPQIGVEIEPAAETPICDIPTYLGTMETSGYQLGDLVNGFSLYNTDGERFQLSQLLSGGKPVLLVSGNYTCWRYRDQLDALNAITNYYAEEMNTFIINTVEAHPYNDISPYSGTVWTTDRNFADGVLYAQPDTYGERLDIIEDMRDSLAIVPEILVDDPCNQWWLNYGPAPNNVYLIDPEGRVRVKQPWLIGYTTGGLWCELSYYFNDNSPYCNEAGNNGTFSVEYSAEVGNTAYGSPGEILTIPTTIQNLSDTENVVIDISRQDVYTQSDWQTALCVNVCYNYTVSEASVTIPPGGEQSFIFYFYTGENEGVGSASVEFRNANSLGNQEVLEFTGVTGITTGIGEGKQNAVALFPNPASSYMQIEVPIDLMGNEYEMYDGKGRAVKKGVLQSTQVRIDVNDLPAGMYFVNIIGIDEVQRVVIK